MYQKDLGPNSAAIARAMKQFQSGQRLAEGLSVRRWSRCQTIMVFDRLVAVKTSDTSGPAGRAR